MIEIINMEPSIMDKIHTLAAHYSKKSQWEKAIEELKELLVELEAAANPFGYEDLVYLPENTWSEEADVMIMCLQTAIQHGKLDTLIEQIKYKLDRQLKRIREEEAE